MSLMHRISEEMDRAFANTFGSIQRGSFGAWSPAIEVHEQDGSVEITAELPGLQKDAIKLECSNDGLIIQGERKQEHEETRGGYRRSERSYGHFYRLIPLPEGALADQAKAEFKDGLLKVHVPVPQQQQRQSRQIPINS